MTRLTLVSGEPGGICSFSAISGVASLFLDAQVLAADQQALAGGQRQHALQALQASFQAVLVPAGDKGSHAVFAHDDALRFQVAQRFAQGGAGDAQLGGQLVFRGELLAGRVGAAVDQIEQVLPRLGRQRQLGFDGVHTIVSHLTSYLLELLYSMSLSLSRPLLQKSGRRSLIRCEQGGNWAFGYP